jgi:hypothetical protein
MKRPVYGSVRQPLNHRARLVTDGRRAAQVVCVRNLLTINLYMMVIYIND